VHIRPDGTQRLIAQSEQRGFADAADDATRFVSGTLPNGLAFARNGDIVISNFGTDRLEAMTRAGETRVLADTLDGRPIGKVNFVLRNSRDRLWLTVSTRIRPARGGSPASAWGGRRLLGPADLRPGRPRRPHRWHRLRRPRQPLGYARDAGPRLRDHAGG
jgi:sugar lactone lactonase YvrE